MPDFPLALAAKVNTGLVPVSARQASSCARGVACPPDSLTNVTYLSVCLSTRTELSGTHAQPQSDDRELKCIRIVALARTHRIRFACSWRRIASCPSIAFYAAPLSQHRSSASAAAAAAAGQVGFVIPLERHSSRAYPPLGSRLQSECSRIVFSPVPLCYPFFFSYRWFYVCAFLSVNAPP